MAEFTKEKVNSSGSFIDKHSKGTTGYETTNVGSFPVGSLPLNDVFGYGDVAFFGRKGSEVITNFTDKTKDE